MKTVLLIVSVAVGLLVVARLVIYLVGRSQPERHTATLRFAMPRLRCR